MDTVEVSDEVRCVDVGFIGPRIFFVPVAFPRDEELESVPEEAAVEDGFDFVLRLSVDDFGIRWWNEAPAGDGVSWRG